MTVLVIPKVVHVGATSFVSFRYFLPFIHFAVREFIHFAVCEVVHFVVCEFVLFVDHDNMSSYVCHS